MWHYKDGGIWYITVPLPPRHEFDPVVPNLYVKSIDPGTPVETDEVGNAVYKAEIGKKYTATVVFGTGEIRRDLDLALLRPFVAGLHEINGQAYKGKLKKISGNGHISEPVPEYPDRFTEAKSQTISFNAENSEITATFEWTAQRGTTQLIAAINDGQYVPRHHEFESTADGKPADMTDNVKKVPIKVEPPPDLCVKELKLHTVLTEPGQVYTGTVIYALKPGYREKVTAKLGLTHNGYSISSTEGKKLDQSMVIFDPQMPETMIQTFSFKFTGLALGHNSEIVAKIWPQEPTMVDAYWPDNSRKALAKSHITDIAVTNIAQQEPAVAGTEELATVTFKNLGANTETFTAHYFAGGKLVKKDKITLPAGKTDTRNFNWAVPGTPGKTITLKVVADPDKKLPDINRANNTCTRDVRITAPALPEPYCQDREKNSREWTVTYVWTTTNSKGETVTHSRDVTYKETISARLILNTRQGDDQAPPEERRGAWEIKPFAKKHKLDPNKITRAGYGFEVLVETDYWTDWETKVPTGAAPKGGTPRDLKLQVEFWDTKNRSVLGGPVELEPIARREENGHTYITWALKPTTHTLSDGRRITDRKHYTDLNNYSATEENIDKGRYYVTVSNINDFGMTGELEICEEDSVIILGNMYDDIYTRPGWK
ncbi:CARDB domain-containing protein [Thermincola potens]|uniref:CARDB domain-containing protein n=1 Tax=Thermincola potens (strain JR) TaxID=635013 RepID=D5XCP5_THEPJ|nr:CARDB domain-containing protein [Thermincola potens]ADG81671.1 hypothetical protein TherJR_0804 [Thermincola potens JR]